MKIKNFMKYFKEGVLKYFKISMKFLNISNWNIWALVICPCIWYSVTVKHELKAFYKRDIFFWLRHFYSWTNTILINGSMQLIFK